MPWRRRWELGLTVRFPAYTRSEGQVIVSRDGLSLVVPFHAVIHGSDTGPVCEVRGVATSAET